MFKHILRVSIILLFFSLSCFYIYNHSNGQIQKINTNIKIKYENINKNLKTKYQTIFNNFKDDSIGRLVINKINLDNKLYEISNQKNNVEKNITILEGSIEPENKKSIMFIAAHSGSGRLAYFKNLDKLNLKDEIKLIYKNKEYHYIVEDIWETEKDGNIEVVKEDKKQLILTTCSQNDSTKQLIINCIEKES